MSGLEKYKLVYDATDVSNSDQVGVFLKDGAGTALTSTLLGGKQSLDVNIASPLSLDVILNGIYDGTTNLLPDNVGLVGHSRNATIGAAQQSLRLSAGSPTADAVVSANVSALDVNAFGMGYNGTTWDRLTATAGALDVNLKSTGIGFQVQGDVADDAVDAGNPVKIGTRAVSGALTAVSAAGDRADAVSDVYRRIFINDSPNIGVATAASAITDTAAAILVAALAGRRRMILQNTGNAEVYVGGASVSSTNGLLVPRGGSLTLEIGPDVALNAVCATGKSSSLRVFELA